MRSKQNDKQRNENFSAKADLLKPMHSGCAKQSQNNLVLPCLLKPMHSDHAKPIHSVFLKQLVCVCIIIMAVFCISGCFGSSDRSDPEKASDNTKTLTVAPYADVPDLAAFKKQINSKWQKQHPNIKLKFIDWSCYKEDPPKDVDVFVFDSMFLNKYHSDGILAEIPRSEIDEKKDYFDFTLDDASIGGKLYGIPQLICTEVLITRSDDEALKNVSDMDELFRMLGSCSSGKAKLPKGRGLFINLGLPNVFPTYYLEGLMDKANKYSTSPTLPSTEDLDRDVCASLKSVVKMAGKTQAFYDFADGNSYVKADWFAGGSGRAIYGYTENLSHLTGKSVTPRNIQNHYRIQKIAMTTGTNVPVFYTDYIAVHKHAKDSGKLEYALDLANLMADDETLKRIISSDEDDCQFLLSARKSVYLDLKKDFPMYGKLYKLAANKRNHVFLLGKNYPEFYEKMDHILAEIVK